MGRISEQDVQRVRDAINVVDLISESVVLKQKGRLFWGLCPFHQEKTPSFKVDPATQLWHCFGCGEGGDVFGFLMKTEHLEFPDAVRTLADRANIEIAEEGDAAPRGHRERLWAACGEAADFYHKTLVLSHDSGPTMAREYLASRGFGIEIAKRFEIGYAPGHEALVTHLRKMGFSVTEITEANLGVGGDRGVRDRFYGRVMFPIRDISGRAIGFGGRVLGGGEPKYLNTQETAVFHKKRNLYAIDRAKNAIVVARQAVVVEGYTDVIALHEAGFENVVATLGTALTREHVKLLSRFAHRIVYLFDADEAGLRAAERALEFIDLALSPIGGKMIELAVAVAPEGKDPADLAAHAGAEGVEETLASAVPLMEFVLNRRLATHDLTTPEGRARALSDAASVLATVRGSLLAQDYANFVADRLQTDYTMVLSAVERARPAFQSLRESSGEGTESALERATGGEIGLGPSAKAERALVGLVGRYVELRTKAYSLLSSDLLVDPVARALLERIEQAGTMPGTDIVTQLQSESPADGEVLSGLLLETDGNEDVEIEARELLRRLKEFALERQIREKRSVLKSLDGIKDRDRSDELTREITALMILLEQTRQGTVPDDDMEAWG